MSHHFFSLFLCFHLSGITASLSTPPLGSCNTSAFTISLNHTQCYGLTELPGKATYQDCFAACCDRSQQMFQFCPPGETCTSYTGPSCWCGAADLSSCTHSPSIPWLGASQPSAPPQPPPTPPFSQAFLPPSRAAIPLLLPDMDLGNVDAVSPSPWTLSVDSGPTRPILVPFGGYSSDAQSPPFIDQYTGVKATATYTRLFTPPQITGLGTSSMVVISFGAVNHGARVYIDGTLVGSHLGPMMPFDVDITAAVMAAGVSTQSPPPPLNLTVETLPYATLVGIVPSGFMYAETWKSGGNGWASRSCAGICRYIRLSVLPMVRITNIATAAAIVVGGSAPQATLAVTVTVTNGSPSVSVPGGSLSFQGSLSSWNFPHAPPWSYPPIPVTPIPGDLPPHSSTSLTIHVDWSSLGSGSWWWPNRPYSPTYLAQLHFLNLTLSTGAASASAYAAAAAAPPVIASASTRFGFVQHGAEEYYYTLNGVRINHLSDASPENALSYYDSYSFPGNFYATSPREVWRTFMALGITSNRVHQSTPTRGMLDAADEVGFLLKPESPVRGGCNYVDCGTGGPDLAQFAQSVGELGGACAGHPSVFAYSVENETGESLRKGLMGALIDAAAASDPSVPLTTEGSDGSTPGFNGTTSGVYAVNLLHYALPDATRTHIRAVGECAWCVEDGLEEFSGLAVAGRVQDVAYYSGWDMFNYWSNFIPGYNASRHAWKQAGCAGRDRVDGASGDGWGSPVVDWVVAGFAPFLPADLQAFASNPRFENSSATTPPWPRVVDSYSPGATVNRSVALFNDVLRGDLNPLSPSTALRVLTWSALWDSPSSGGSPVAGGEIPVTVTPGFHTVVNVVFTAPSPGGGGGGRKLFIVYRNEPQGGGGGEELVGVENRVYVLIE